MRIRSTKDLIMLTSHCQADRFRRTLAQLQERGELPSTLDLSRVQEIQVEERQRKTDKVILDKYAQKAAGQIKDWLHAHRVLADGNRLEPALFLLESRSMLTKAEKDKLHVVMVPKPKPRIVSNSRSVCEALRNWKKSVEPLHMEDDLATKFF